MQWISFKENMECVKGEYKQPFLVLDQDGNIFEVSYYQDDFDSRWGCHFYKKHKRRHCSTCSCDIVISPTHWMPLPKPPKE